MTRLRTGNNRRRAKELKQGGLYRIVPYRPDDVVGITIRWRDSGKAISLSLDQIRELRD